MDEIAHRQELAEDEERRVHHQPNYMAIFWWLFGLTVLPAGSFLRIIESAKVKTYPVPVLGFDGAVAR